MKKRIKILSSTIALVSIGVSAIASVSLINSNILSPKSTTITNTDNTKNDDKSDLVPAQANGQNANISTNAGPITFNGNVITALDWYGNKLWQIDMSTYVKEPTPHVQGKDEKNSGYRGSWRRAWYNWDYDRNKNILWVLGYGYLSNQSIFGFNADTGALIKSHDLGPVGNGVDKKQSPYKFVTALSSGKVLIYGDPSKTYSGTGLLYDPENGTTNKLNGNSDSHLPKSDGDSSHKNTYRWYFYNLVPLATNKNLVEVVAFDNRTSGGTTGDGSANRATYNVYGLLVDDELNFIGDKQNSIIFQNAYKLANGVEGFRNTTITPKRDYFTLLNNQTVSVTYNTVTLFDTKDPNNIQIKQVQMTNQNIIQTWTVDSNDNLYFKFLKDGKVYKIDSSTLKSGSSSLSPSTYLDLSGNQNESIKSDASNFVIYNVYGYTGQLMMIDASYDDRIDIYSNILDSNDNTGKNWGLAIAVTSNKNQSTTGDFKGILNGKDSIQKAADFTIDQNTLNSKIPSEITKSDIKLLNDAFFKSSDSKPFIISDVDDSKGTFTLTANLYKIPWFSETLPDKSVPSVVSYTFSNNDSSHQNAQSIDKKVSWKILNSSTNYDFMNMLPTNVSLDDIKNLDPFQASFQSQVITDGSGNQIYPKTTYSIGDRNNDNGTITINVNYEYVPMSATYTDGKDKTYNFGSKPITEKEVQTYTAKRTYNIFKKNGNSAFWFTGATNQSSDDNKQTVDVTKVPQLKNLLSAGKLPSSFANLNSDNDSSNSQFLQFVNTSSSQGYPISKMNFSVSPDDTNGTLTITATMPAQYSPDSNSHTYSVKYTGLNQQKSYSFSFRDVNAIDGVNINTILPSAVDEGEIIKNFVSYNGFDSNDFSVILTPNDEQGTLSVKVNLNKSYASSIATSNGFVNDYSITKTFSGFMTTSEYNSRFSITFKGDDDPTLLTLKSMQANEIVTAFGSDGKGTGNLKVGNDTFNSLNEFVKNLLVKSTGSSIPINWDSSGVTTNVYVDNNLGIASFYVNIPKDKVVGSTSDLNFVVTYSGFVKGNVDSTSDNLSFVSDAMLKNYLLTTGFKQEDIDKLTPTTFAKWANDNIGKLITYKTGEYVTKLNDKNKGYTLTITPNDLQGTVSITINFGTMTNQKSLSEYTVQYTI